MLEVQIGLGESMSAKYLVWLTSPSLLLDLVV